VCEFAHTRKLRPELLMVISRMPGRIEHTVEAGPGRPVMIARRVSSGNQDVVTLMPSCRRDSAMNRFVDCCRQVWKIVARRTSGN
jgi:hypothetical protein